MRITKQKFQAKTIKKKPEKVVERPVFGPFPNSDYERKMDQLTNAVRSIPAPINKTVEITKPIEKIERELSSEGLTLLNAKLDQLTEAVQNRSARMDIYRKPNGIIDYLVIKPI